MRGHYTVTTTQSTQDLTLTLTGQEQDAGHVTLAIAGTSEAMSGTVNGATMQTSGQGGNLTWYAASSEQFSQLQAAYRAYVNVQADLSTLQTVEGTPPNNSYPGYFQSALQGAQSRVKDEQASLTYIQQQQDALTRCMALSEFTANFPAASQDGELHLPYSTPGDTSGQAVVNRS